MESAFDRLSPTLAIWHRYDPKVKADLFSTALKTEDGVYLIDPIADLPDALRGEKVVGIIVTNDNHARATADFAARLAVPIHASADVRDGLEHCDVIRLNDGQQIAPGLVAIALPGAALGEIALHQDGDGGTLIVGDALINMESHGFTFLPAKYCENAKLMRKSLPKLLDYSFERILFAHGTPIVSRAHSRLVELLHGNAEIARE
ncbi:MAG: hypothetical protein ABI946_03960 [Chthoniobacterales bacterium]